MFEQLARFAHSLRLLPIDEHVGTRRDPDRRRPGGLVVREEDAEGDGLVQEILLRHHRRSLVHLQLLLVRDKEDLAAVAIEIDEADAGGVGGDAVKGRAVKGSQERS